MLSIGLGLLILHFGLIVIYANPFSNAVKSKKDYIALYYAYPYFHQNWNLFVPPPITNYKLFAEFENNGLQKKEIFGDILIRHQSNRFKGYGPLALTFGNCIHYFEKNTALQKYLNGPVKNDINFTILEHAARNYLQHTYKADIKNLRLFLFTEDLGNKKQRVYFN